MRDKIRILFIAIFLLISTSAYAITGSGITINTTDCLINGSCTLQPFGSPVFAYSISKSGITDNTPTDLFTITVPSGGFVAGALFYGVSATGGSSDIQIHSGSLYFVCANKGGTFSKSINEMYTNANDTIVKTAGTLTDTWTMKAGNVCTLDLTLSSNLSSAVDSVSGVVIIYGTNTFTAN